MGARLLKGGPLAQDIRAGLSADVAALRAGGKPVRLATVLVQGDPESEWYVRHQQRACQSVGIEFELVQVSPAIGQVGLLNEIEALNANPAVHGVILQMPLPAAFDADLALRALDPHKDVEGIHPSNLGLILYGMTHLVPCTALAAYTLLKSSGVDLYGKNAVMVGDSKIVGKPMTQLLLHGGATVTTCHKGTRNLAEHTRRAEVLVVAVGKPGLITGEMIREGALIVDIGTNQVPELDAAGRPVLDERGKPKEKLVGDVCFEGACPKASWISPVPGGVGPLTVAMLLRNVVRAAKVAYRLEDPFLMTSRPLSQQ